MPHQNHDIACAKTWSCVLTPFSVAYTTSISGRQRALIEFLRMTGGREVRVHTDMYTDLHLPDRLSFIDCGKRTGT